ncbi:AmmeMemoRadiSam system radical SAM enzyme [Marinilabiliaceae bacterium ANBcel2]|nr:AmmeMemoRadiSam system radical SAM enzyme [Marinilabiliaceae bacterium ANBcel2]
MQNRRGIAQWWKRENLYIYCHLCPHQCKLKDGERGICNSRVNENGTLYTEAWNLWDAVNCDPVEKKPLFHFLPGSRTLSVATNGCNLRCLNCQNHKTSQTTPGRPGHTYCEPKDTVNAAIKYECSSISYTYSDPVVYYEQMLETAKEAKKSNLKNIMVSAGYINPAPLKELIPWIDAVNIDLKSFSSKTYKQLCKVELKPVLKSLKEIKESGTWLEITNLIIPEYTDDEQTIKLMCKWLVKNSFAETPLHFNRFFPAHKLSHLPPTPVEKINKAIYIAKNEGIKYIYSGNMLTDIHENSYCHNCNHIIIERSGYRVIDSFMKKNACSQCNTVIPGYF